MSKTKTLSDIIKVAPTLTDLNSQPLLMSITNGNICKAPTGILNTVKDIRVTANNYVKIENIGAAFVSIRVSLGDACRLVWISCYGQGYGGRTTYASLGGVSIYPFYMNGSSISKATFFVKNPHADQIMNVYVAPLDTSTPVLTQVSSIPSDCVQIL